MKKLFLSLLLGMSGALATQAQLLFKITGKDLQKPSYIVGTYHLADASFANQIAGIKTVLNDVEQVCGELKMSDEQNPDTLAMMTKFIMMPEGKTLQTTLSAAQQERLSAYLKDVVGAGFENPMLAGQLGKLTPAALMTQLELMSFTKKMQGKFDPQNAMDNYFQKAAIEAGKPAIGLETYAFQLSVIFGDPMQKQVEALMCFIDNKEFNEQMVDKTILTYNAQDTEEMVKMIETKMGNECDATAEDLDKILYNRNRNWLTLMPAIMAAKSTLFAVGAGHLGSEKGVLQLLRNAGYTVEGVK